MPAPAVAYPMIFTIRELVSTEPFLAGVTVRGRGLLVPEDGSWWFSGVEPGGVAVSGGSPQEAYLRFIEAFKTILSEISAEAKNFKEFAEQVTEFVQDADREDEVRWLEAAAAIRSGALKPDAPFSSLPKEPAESPCYVQVEPLDKATSFTVGSTRHESTLAIPAAA